MSGLGVNLYGVTSEQVRTLQDKEGCNCCEHEHEHGHGHGHGVEDGHGHSHNHDGEDEVLLHGDGSFEMDPGLQQCCIKEMEHRREHAKLMKKLRAVDPVAKVENRIENVLKISDGASNSTRRWMELTLRAAEVEDELPKTDKQEQQEDYDSSDIDSEFEDDEIFAKFCQERMTQQQQRMMTFTRDRDVAHFMKDNEHVPVTFICFTSEKTDLEFSKYLTEMMERIGNENKELVKCCAVAFDALYKDHPLFENASQQVVVDAPCVIGYQALKSVVVFDKPSLQRDKDLIETWIKSNCTRSKKVTEEEEQQEGSGSFCDRPGCDRNFPHEHIAISKTSREFYYQNEEGEEM